MYIFIIATGFPAAKASWISGHIFAVGGPFENPERLSSAVPKPERRSGGTDCVHCVFPRNRNPPRQVASVVKHSHFKHMKANADEMFPGMPLVEGGRTFVNEGSNGRWRDVLNTQEIAEYEGRALAELGPDCARWLATGSV